MTKTVKANFRLLLLIGFIHAGIFYAQGQNTTVKERSLTSAILNKKVKLLVSVPEGYKTSKKNYPILYVTNASTKTVEETAADVQRLMVDEVKPICAKIRDNSCLLPHFKEQSLYLLRPTAASISWGNLD